ncbi:MAG: cupin domain-containing protein, partial [Pseudomonadota bacterium]|nr:cupin domain-containing protein [Pseudomonadota bacterium]
MLNMDFSKTVVIDTTTMPWVPSPAAGANFRGHNHPLGEEILVLDGTFSDETGDFGAGTYFRNPP